jgi:hypothetical protein
MRKLGMWLLIVLPGLTVIPASAQLSKGKSTIGPSLGFYFFGSTPIFGANYEYAMNTDVGDGILGIGGLLRYWSWSEDIGVFGGQSWGWSYTDIMIGAQGNYHFKVGDGKLDPWLGATLAYDIGSVKYKGPSGYTYVSPTWGGFFIGANGGIRYWLSPNLGIVARLGLGALSYSALDVGVDFKF